MHLLAVHDVIIDLMAVEFVDDSVTLPMDNKNHFDVFVATFHPKKRKKKKYIAKSLNHF